MSDEEDYDYEYEYTDDEDGGENESMDISTAQGEKVVRDLGMETPRGDKESFGIRMLPAGELKAVMKSHVGEASEVLGVPPCAAAILLREHKWAKERLFQAFFDNPEKVEEKCGVLARCQAGASKGGEATAAAAQNGGRATRSAAATRKHCEICMDDDGFDDDEMIRMPCGHEFCETCWYGYVSNAMDKGPVCVRETCPESGCGELITEGEVARAAPDLLPKFEDYQLRSFVETNGSTRWCPGPGCEQVAMAPGSGMFADVDGDAKCTKCETCFCLGCGEEPHAPITCADLRKWQEKLADESETANWILANSKPCPSCSTRIEKNQGCNHMTCRSCKHEFCWICMGNWHDHGANTGGYYKCNKFDPNAGDGDNQSSAAKAKRELDRYLHYYKRFHGHSQAQDFARKSVKKTEERMIALQEQNSETAWTDVEFLKAANEQLVECRRVLKYTYAYAFYLQDENRQVFEYHQEMLERFTENLSELSEKPLQDMNRTEVVNQTRVVARFMEKVVEYVRDGED